MRFWVLMLSFCLSVECLYSESSSSWRFLGPPGGNINRIVFDPTSNFVYANGRHLFRSNDAGRTWRILPVVGIDVRVHPRTGKLMVFTGRWLSFSTDHGNTWQRIKPALPQIAIN